MVNKEKWQKMSLAKQMGNIGSEVVKAFSFKERSDQVWLGQFQHFARVNQKLFYSFCFGGQPPKMRINRRNFEFYKV